MSGKKKISPQHRMITVAESRKQIRGACERTWMNTMLLVSHVLLDKEGFDDESIKHFYRAIEDIAEEISKGNITWADIQDALKQENGMQFVNIFSNRWLK